MSQDFTINLTGTWHIVIYSFAEMNLNHPVLETDLSVNELSQWPRVYTSGWFCDPGNMALYVLGLIIPDECISEYGNLRVAPPLWEYHGYSKIYLLYFV